MEQESVDGEVETPSPSLAGIVTGDNMLVLFNSGKEVSRIQLNHGVKQMCGYSND